ncbi:peptidoglycan-binding protein [Micromonospora sp. CPCC 205711]|uniref:peptidoglycan-binding protein n=1 Tax=Micromonospora sp. CPCC 205547 TaxID=3122400 RepID=UPI002FF2E8F2
MSGVDGGPTMSGWRRRRRIRTWAMAGTGVAVLAVAAAATVGLGTGDPEPAASDPRSVRTVEVTRGNLVDYVVLDGQVGYGPPTPMRCEATGTTTWLAPAGATVQRGGSLLRVNDQPVVLLYGSLPMYRSLAAPATGKDVEQFERNLRELGYTGFSVDEVFSAATTAAVKRWQRDLGRPETGTVEVGQLIYAPGPVRVARQSVRVGAAVPAEVLTWTGTTRVVTAAVEPADATWATPGAKVAVTLPDGRTTPGTVRTVGEEATPGGAEGDGAAPAQPAAGSTIPIAITVADQKSLSGAARGAVEVRHVAQERKNVLTVPVSALLALAEGGYGVEVVEAESTRIVAVKAGMFADGRVEVSGPGIQAGAMVRIPQ